MKIKFKKIIISRTDNLGDVMLTLPLCGWLKEHLPEVKIAFLGKSYTRPLIEACVHVDEFLDVDELYATGPDYLRQAGADVFIHVFPNKKIAFEGKKAGIRFRIGTTHRWYHLLTCNVPVSLSRKNSPLHEAQLNIALTAGFFRLTPPADLSALYPYYGFEALKPLPPELQVLLPTEDNLKKIIFHPKSNGSAEEWGLANFTALARKLPADNYRIFVTGTQKEGDLIHEEAPELLALPHVTNLCGKMSLAELMTFIKECDALIAASTGPLHIAAAVGIKAIGLYVDRRPVHPGRWAPIGLKAKALSVPENLSGLSVERVLEEL